MHKPSLKSEIEAADFKAKYKLGALSYSYYISCVSDGHKEKVADVFKGKRMMEEGTERGRETSGWWWEILI